MMKRFWVTLMTLFLVLLTGCQGAKICVSVQDTSASHLVVNFETGGWQECDGRAVDVTNLGFYEPGTQHILWKIYSIDSLRQVSSPIDTSLRSITYGVTPRNFEGNKVTKLHPGQVIEFRIRGAANRVTKKIKLTE
jgi:hypothetical protein